MIKKDFDTIYKQYKSKNKVETVTKKENPIVKPNISVEFIDNQEEEGIKKLKTD